MPSFFNPIIDNPGRMEIGFKNLLGFGGFSFPLAAGYPAMMGAG